MNKEKQKLIDKLRDVIARVQKSLQQENRRLVELINKPLSEIKSLLPEDQMVYANLKYNAENRIQELNNLYTSPFFVKCELEISSTKEKKILYFAKHHFSDELIYSWVAPIARIRFDKPGPVEYKLPNGITEKGILTHKEQYLIVDGKVVFFAIEDGDNPRELIYQEHFSSKKDGFILPEIVAVMEKAQDTVIRAHHVGPFVISGPAGSGKTTLALHRVAFLVQAPDTAHIYPGESIIVLVQDNGTKEYFSHLLPELGIKNVRITTFFEWASEILGLEEAVYLDRRGNSEDEKDQIEFERLLKIRQDDIPSWDNTKIFLKKYQSSGLDRIDITTALMSFLKHFKRFEIKTQYRTVIKGELKEKTRKTIPKYSLMVIDEFQNYMPEQIKLLSTCTDPDTKSMIFVGDIAQQIVPGAVRSWHDIELDLSDDRQVRLYKVYRNTKQILGYIKSLGYVVDIPEGIREGNAVSEKIVNDESEVIEYIDNLLKTKEGIVGLIGKDINKIDYLKKIFKNEKRIHIMTMASSQGVEFDTVCIVGIDNDLFLIKNTNNFPESYTEEKKRINRDLLYVALTRAISNLHIIGTCTITSLMSPNQK